MPTIISTEQLLQVASYWADLPWPLRAAAVDQYLAALGWRRSDLYREAIATTLPLNDPSGGVYVSGRFVDFITIRTSDILRPTTPEWTSALESGYAAGIEALSQRYGEPVHRQRRRQRFAAWEAPSATLIKLVFTDRVLSLDVVAPHLVFSELEDDA